MKLISYAIYSFSIMFIAFRFLHTCLALWKQGCISKHEFCIFIESSLKEVKAVELNPSLVSVNPIIWSSLLLVFIAFVCFQAYLTGWLLSDTFSFMVLNVSNEGDHHSRVMVVDLINNGRGDWAIDQRDEPESLIPFVVLDWSEVSGDSP